MLSNQQTNKVDYVAGMLSQVGRSVCAVCKGNRMIYVSVSPPHPRGAVYPLGLLATDDCECQLQQARAMTMIHACVHPPWSLSLSSVVANCPGHIWAGVGKQAYEYGNGEWSYRMACVCMCVYVCVCVCVFKRERGEIEREREREKHTHSVRMCLCVRARMCVSERDRQRQRETETESLGKRERERERAMTVRWPLPWHQADG